ncbi:MAG: radical SAM protein [Acidimicrobiales bacterium]|nr:radical SAM protein [Acidimicrobiales bacterium]
MRLSLPTPVRRPSRRRRSDPAVSGPLCRAPFTSMYLDQHGDVRACCMNDTFPLGNVTAAPLEEIWRGEAARRLRRAIEAGDLDLGCGFCRPAVERGRPDQSYARWFEEFDLDGADPPWPRQLELSITNTCNLRCVMCNGEWSSSIRAQVEHRPPLPTVYDDAFFDQLRPFLAHLDRVKLYGGEPFLASETLRVMEMLVEEGLTTRCHLTTNGTQWTPRVERILSMLPVDVSVSLDAASAETYESIRRGSSWAQVRANLDRFCEWGRRRETFVSVTFCLLTVNWHELGAFFALADSLGVDGTVNQVSQPAHLTLEGLDDDEFEHVVTTLEGEDDRWSAALGQNRPMWEEQLALLQAAREQRRAAPTPTPVPAPPAETPVVAPVPGVDQAQAFARAARDAAAGRPAAGDGPDAPGPWCERHVPAGAACVALDEDGRVCREPAAGVLTLDPGSLDGRHHGEIQGVVAAALGPIERVDHVLVADRVELSSVHLRDGRVLDVVATPVPDDDAGEGDGVTVLYFSWATAGGSPPP